MKQLITTLAIAFTFAAGSAQAASHAASNPQQGKMAACNADPKAKELKGDERKKFMSECLKAKPAKPATQQDKMKSCNADPKAKELKGDERKKFMSECLKK